jgi:uncharacterized protein (TIGR03066 family)
MNSKERIRPKNQVKPSPRPTPARGSWKRPLLLALAVLVAAGGTWVVLEFLVWNKVPAELVGKWVVTEGPDEGGTIDFYRNGTMVGTVNNRGLTDIIKGKVRVEDKKIYVTTRHQQTGAEGTKVQLIKVLDEKHLILQDERGTLLRLERAE